MRMPTFLVHILITTFKNDYSTQIFTEGQGQQTVEVARLDKQGLFLGRGSSFIGRNDNFKDQ